MKISALKTNQHPEVKVSSAKKVWVKPEVEMISIQLSRDNKIGPEGSLTRNSISVYHS